MRTIFVSAALVCLTLAGTAVRVGAQADAKRTTGQAVGAQDWPMYNYDAAGSRHNAGETTLSKENVGRLEEKWRFPPKGSELQIGAIHATPTVVNGCVYFGTVNKAAFYKLAPDGTVEWTFPLNQKDDRVLDRFGNGVFSSALVAGDAVYFATGAGFVYALDRDTGKEKWRVDMRAESFPGAHPMNGAFASPILADGKIVVAGGASEQVIRRFMPNYRGFTGRGFVVALEPRTGRVAWKYDVGPKPERLDPPVKIKDDYGEHVFQFGPATSMVWSTPSYHAASRTIFFGTDTNNAPRRPTKDDPRLDTRYACAVVALDAGDGSEKWVTQINRGDVWNAAMRGYDPDAGRYKDMSVGDTPKVFTITRGKVPTLVVGFGCKNGGFYVARASDGKILAHTPLYEGPPTYPLQPPPGKRVLALPGLIGGLQTGCATDGKRVYTNGIDAIRLGTQKSRFGGGPPTGGRVVAISLDTKEEYWRHERPKVASAGGPPPKPVLKNVGDPVASGLAVANGVVYFTTLMSSKLMALDAASGKVLREIQLPPVWSGPAVSRGRVYVGTGNMVMPDAAIFGPSRSTGTLFSFGLPGAGEVGRTRDTRTLTLTTTEVTDADVAIAPDGKQSVFSLLGHLFRMSAGGGDAEQLTFGACYDSDPAYSPDGRSVAFVSDRDGSGGNVFLLDLGTSKLTQVTHESQAGQPTWAPDGEAIYYLRFLPREQDPRTPSLLGGPALCDLRRIAPGGGEPEPIRKAGLFRSIFFLKDGQPAWTRIEQQNTPGGFFPRSTTRFETAAPKGGAVTHLLTAPGDLGRVVGSPDGDGVYLRTPQVRFVRLPGGPAPKVSGFPGGAAATRFAVTADGKTAYTSERGQLVKTSVASGARAILKFRAQVKLEVANPARPKWTAPEVGGAVKSRGVLSPILTPDGRGLIFMAAGYLWRQNLDGNEPARRLLTGDGWERDPALAPDGRHLAFVSSRHGKRAVRILDLESGKTRTLVDLGRDSWARFPSWSGDGKRLVFQKSDGLQSPSTLIAVSILDGTREKLAGVAGNWSARPHFAGVGDALYFTTRDGGPGTLYGVSLNAKANREAVTQLARHLSDARVSPDGKWVAFRRNAEVWLAPLGTKPIREKDVRRLNPEGGATFRFTADSSAVVYSVGGRVWRHPLNGGNREEIPVRLGWRSPTPPPLLLRRVRVLDLDAGKFGPETSLLIEKGVIRGVGPDGERELPRNAVILDAAGKYAIPGLFDFHVHSAWANHEADPDAFLAYGVTSVRETGGRLETLCALTDRGAVSADAVPRYFFCGEIFEGARPIWGDDASLQIYTAGDARNQVRRAKARGAHFLKVYPSLPWNLQQVTAAEAREQGLPVIGHGLSHEETVRSVTLGFASLEHAPISLYDDVRQMLVAAGTRCTPTLSILGGHSALLRREPKRLDDAKLRTYFSEATVRAARFGGFPGGTGGGRFTNVGNAHRAGVRIHAGTDSLMIGTLFGASLHWELEHLVEAGLKPLDVLRMATRDAAEAVGAGDRLGTLAPGKLADIVLLDADPLDNIRNTQAIWRVVKGGWVFDPKELRQAGK